MYASQVTGITGMGCHTQLQNNFLKSLVIIIIVIYNYSLINKIGGGETWKK
jgi:hypothetical protein